MTISNTSGTPESLKTPGVVSAIPGGPPDVASQPTPEAEGPQLIDGQTLISRIGPGMPLKVRVYKPLQEGSQAVSGSGSVVMVGEAVSGWDRLGPCIVERRDPRNKNFASGILELQSRARMPVWGGGSVDGELTEAAKTFKFEVLDPAAGYTDEELAKIDAIDNPQ